MSNWTQAQANNKSNEYAEAAPAGPHAANVVALIDLGTQNPTYNGETSRKRQVFIIWELCSVYIEGTKNRHLIGHVYTQSGHKKASLRQMLESWRGKAYAEGETYDLAKILGQACLLTIDHKESESTGRTFARIKSVSPLHKSIPTAPPLRPLINREVTDSNPVPDWIPFIIGEDPNEVIARAEELRKPAPTGRPAARPADRPNGMHTSRPAHEVYPEDDEQQVFADENTSEIPF